MYIGLVVGRFDYQVRTAAIVRQFSCLDVDSGVFWNGSKYPQVLYSSSLHSVYKLIVRRSLSLGQ